MLEGADRPQVDKHWTASGTLRQDYQHWQVRRQDQMARVLWPGLLIHGTGTTLHNFIFGLTISLICKLSRFASMCVSELCASLLYETFKSRLRTLEHFSSGLSGTQWSSLEMQISTIRDEFFSVGAFHYCQRHLINLLARSR